MTTQALLAVGGLITVGALAYVILAIVAVARWPLMALTGEGAATWPSVCVLKPLCGAEDGLEEALRSFFVQDYPGDLRLVFGVRDSCDPALEVVRTLAASYPQAPVSVVCDASLHGANLKISNLINMAEGLGEEVVVISDSDVCVAANALRCVVAPLQDPEVGAATCIYRGRPAAPDSLVAQLGALYLDLWYIPTIFVQATLSPLSVCLGPLTALPRDVLQRAGGFAALADCLADDSELGHLARRQGLKVAIAPTIVETYVGETRLLDLLGHELRWAKTTRALRPAGYAASIFTHPGPIPWLLLALRPHAPEAILALALLGARLMLLGVLRRRLGKSPGTWHGLFLLAPLREQLYFAVWVAGFFGRSIRWRGEALRIRPNRAGWRALRSPGLIKGSNEA